jgi:hypothetical protein
MSIGGKGHTLVIRTQKVTSAKRNRVARGKAGLTAYANQPEAIDLAEREGFEPSVGVYAPTLA